MYVMYMDMVIKYDNLIISYVIQGCQVFQMQNAMNVEDMIRPNEYDALYLE